jgi:hypothetical protein
LGGGITLRAINVHGGTLPAAAYWSVVLEVLSTPKVYPGTEGAQAEYWLQTVEQRIAVNILPFSIQPPRFGWRVEEAVSDTHAEVLLTGMQGILGTDFQTLEEAVTAVTDELRAYDAQRRLGAK